MLRRRAQTRTAEAAVGRRVGDEAAANLATTRKLVADCSYHRREEELAELSQPSPSR
jgi:hypothetical protein